LKKRTKKEHICKKGTYCICSSVSLEPEETCPMHGSEEFPPRCIECGKFIKWKNYVKIKEQ